MSNGEIPKSSETWLGRLEAPDKRVPYLAIAKHDGSGEEVVMGRFYSNRGASEEKAATARARGVLFLLGPTLLAVLRKLVAVARAGKVADATLLVEAESAIKRANEAQAKKWK